MKVRKVVTVSAIAIALASGPAIAGVAQADPNPPPQPTPAPAAIDLIPTLVVEDAQEIVADAIQQAGHSPEDANEIAQRIVGHYLP